MSINTVLSNIEDRLSGLQGIKTCKVGLEENITPDSYPLIRIVPNTLKRGDSGIFRTCELLIYAGLPLHESQAGLGEIYNKLLELEEGIISLTKVGEDYKSTWVRTMLSGNEVSHYRLVCVVIEVTFQ